MHPESFYITGGTVPRDALCYVTRRADDELYAGLAAGDFCYVLTSRQMGKSSLMVRAAQRLREAGAAVLTFDLTALGQNVSAEQWYTGLLLRLGYQAGMEDELEEWWLAHGRLGPLERFFRALCEVVMTRCAGPVVVFVDEIDTVRSLPFSTDEFFAAIRECYNRRTADPNLARLAFCLLGVASPSDLIRDTRLTPFNIGRRIELTDFTAAEAGPLGAGIAVGAAGAPLRPSHLTRRLLKRVLHWTGGHPYLTQRLCRAISEDASVRSAAAVDRHCRALFLNPGARETDDNLIFVRERVLRSEVGRTSLLERYAAIRRTEPRPRFWPAPATDAANDPAATVLRLAGLVRAERGHLRVRNHIYRRVFDGAWIREQMPDAELRRQRAAYRRGVARTTAVSGVLVVAMAGLTAWALRSGAETRRLLYFSNMNRIQAYYDADPYSLARIAAILDETAKSEFRGFEWGYWWLRLHPERHTFPGSASTLSPDGRLALTTSGEGELTLWDAETGERCRSLEERGNHLPPVFSARGDLVLQAGEGTDAAGAVHASLTVWDARTGKRRAAFAGAGSGSVILAASGGVCALRRGAAELLAGVGRAPRRLDRWEAGNFEAGAFAPGPLSRLVTRARQAGVARVTLWDPEAGRRLAELGTAYVADFTFSADGRRVATHPSAPDGPVEVWDTRTGRLVNRLGPAEWVGLSADGSLAALRVKNAIEVWSVQAGRRERRIDREGVRSARFGADGRALLTFPTTPGVTESPPSDARVEAWDLRTGRQTWRAVDLGAGTDEYALSPRGDRLAIVVSGEDTDPHIAILDAHSGRNLARLPGDGAYDWLEFSPNGSRLLAHTSNNETAAVEIWDVSRRRSVWSAPVLRYAPGIAWANARFSDDGATVRLLTGGPGSFALRRVAVADGRLLEDRPLGPDSPLALGPRERLALVRSTTRFTMMDTGTALPLSSIAAGDSTVAVLSGDGRRLVTGLAGRFRTWDTRTGRQLAEVHEPDRSPTFALSPAGDRLLTHGAGTARSARLWDAGTGRLIARLTGPVVQSGASFSGDGRRVLMLGRVWDTATGRLVAPLAQPGQDLDAQLSPDGTRVAAKGQVPEGYALRLWDAESGRRIAVLLGRIDARPNFGTATVDPEDPPNATFAFSADSSRVLVYGNRQPLVLFSAHDGRSIAAYGVYPSAVAASRDGGRLLIQTAEGCRLVEPVGPLLPPWLAHGEAGSNHADFTPDGRYLLAGTTLWEHTGPLAYRPLITLTSLENSGAPSPDGLRMVTPSDGWDDQPVVWDRRGRPVLLLGDGATGMLGASYSPDGRSIVTADAQGRARLWDAQAGRAERTLEPHAGELREARFIGPGTILIRTATQASLWEADSGRRIWAMPLPAETSALALSPDGRRLLTGEALGSIRLWNVGGRRPRREAQAHTNSVRAVAFSPDGTRLVTAGADGTLRMYDSDDLRETLVLRNAQLQAIAFSPDGEELVVCPTGAPARVFACGPLNGDRR